MSPVRIHAGHHSCRADENPVGFLRIGDLADAVRRGESTGIADLSAGLGVKGSRVYYYGELALADRFGFLAVSDYSFTSTAPESVS